MTKPSQGHREICGKQKEERVLNWGVAKDEYAFSLRRSLTSQMSHYSMCRIANPKRERRGGVKDKVRDLEERGGEESPGIVC